MAEMKAEQRHGETVMLVVPVVELYIMELVELELLAKDIAEAPERSEVVDTLVVGVVAQVPLVLPLIHIMAEQVELGLILQ
jgi:hypothetical protein